MTTNETDDNRIPDCDVFVAMKGNEMTATTRTRTRKAAVVEPTIDVELDDLTVVSDDDIADDVTPAPKAPKYLNHANCGHATKGDAGKAARAACRRAIRAMVAAELEATADDEVSGDDIAV